MTTAVIDKVYKARFFRWTNNFGIFPVVGSMKEHDDIKGRLETAVNRLAQFGTPDEIADFLSRQGIRGTIGVSNDCPIAVWLRIQLGGKTVRVSSTISVPLDGVSTVIDCPPVVNGFYNKFDAGLYPTLQRPGTPVLVN